MSRAEHSGLTTTQSAAAWPRWASFLIFCSLVSLPVSLHHWHLRHSVPDTVEDISQPAAVLPMSSTRDHAAYAVLSAHDAGYYRAAFAAQQISDWPTADRAMAQVTDKRLFGHVLADRYLRGPLSPAEARHFMALYADLPEAGAVYAKAQHMYGSVEAPLNRPAAFVGWNAGIDFGNPFGFRSTQNGAAPLATPKSAGKIAAALKHGDVSGAHALLATEIQHGQLTVPAAIDLLAHDAAALYYDGQTDAARRAAHLAGEAGNALGLWTEGLASWKAQDYANAARVFASLARTPNLSPWDRAAACFWAWRGAQRMGDARQAAGWLAEVAQYPHSFYGLLATTLLQKPAHSWAMPRLTIPAIQLLAGQSQGWQALGLLQIGQDELAEAALRRVNAGGDRDLQTAMLALAETTQMSGISLSLSGAALNNGQTYEAARYPVPRWQPANGFQLDRALIYALMKRESQFNPHAISPRGACGLMQIMPATAHELSQNQSDPRGCSRLLFDPASNMALGQKYVRVLADQPLIGDNLLLMLAAYNGGPGNVAHWLDKSNNADPLLFLESLPVRETHDYIQQVLIHYWMYRSRLAEPELSAAQLARGQWPRYDLAPAQRAKSPLAVASNQRLQ